MRTSRRRHVDRVANTGLAALAGNRHRRSTPNSHSMHKSCRKRNGPTPRSTSEEAVFEQTSPNTPDDWSSARRESREFDLAEVAQTQRNGFCAPVQSSRLDRLSNAAAGVLWLVRHVAAILQVVEKP